MLLFVTAVNCLSCFVLLHTQYIFWACNCHMLQGISLYLNNHGPDFQKVSICLAEMESMGPNSFILAKELVLCA